ncbi:cupredoxin domain-containing protein [Nitratireductor sp. CH_MIT9313-5]|jgi:uncharacterized cupredoxin-like copper-binding protein|uniref:cupredoxin domain-containing protein n=1 Tax=Nitratireductor sp. CH_MIT9313-5 TaxID=3107764 RepID=UPI00300B39A2
MKYLILTASAVLYTLSAQAAGTHAGGHGLLPVGEPGDRAEVNRTVTVELTEADSGEMVFRPSSLEVKRGETVRFALRNTGELEHEFVLGTHENLMRHKEEMMANMDMDHEDANAVRLQPGEEGELVWSFTNGGNFEFACLIPGHYESGMVGSLDVNDAAAQN